MAALAILTGACTISSESPGAASAGGLAGPSSGTTTTAGGGGGTSTAGGSDEPQLQATGGGTATDGSSGGDPDTSGTAATAEGAGTGPGAAASGGEAGADGQGAAAGEPAGPGNATATGDTAAPAADAASPLAGDTATDPPGAGAGDGSTAGAGDGSTGDGSTDGVPAPATVPATDTAGAPAAAGGAFDSRSKVSTVGIGSVYFGMSPEESAERVGTVWAGMPAGGSDCYVITPADGPPGVALWVYHGTVERVDIDTPLLRTQSGLGVGTHLGELRSRLGEKLVVEDHPYLPGWTLATFVPTDPNDAAFRIAFDISGGEVIRFRAGRTELVALESCA